VSDRARTGYTPLVLLLLARRPMTQLELADYARRWTAKVPAVSYRPGGLRDSVEELVQAGVVGRAPRPGPDMERAYAVIDPAGGHTAAQSALRDLLRTPTRRLSDFPVAISVLPLLDPAEALTELERRRADVRQRMTELGPRPDDEHPYLCEGSEVDQGQVRAYLHATATAEGDWLTRIIRDLRAGRLSWTPSHLVTLVAGLDRPDAPS
jgi:hypothetical protein